MDGLHPLRSDSLTPTTTIMGFTAGVWDCFHHGHEKALTFCASRCNLLIVGVCSDSMVQRIKGHNRPFHSFSRRRHEVLKTRLAHRVIKLEDLDYRKYLQMADVWFKCEDQYSEIPDDWPNIVWFPRTPGVSTTQNIPLCTRQNCRIRTTQEREEGLHA